MHICTWCTTYTNPGTKKKSEPTKETSDIPSWRDPLGSRVCPKTPFECSRTRLAFALSSSCPSRTLFWWPWACCDVATAHFVVEYLGWMDGVERGEKLRWSRRAGRSLLQFMKKVRPHLGASWSEQCCNQGVSILNSKVTTEVALELGLLSSALQIFKGSGENR